VRVARVTLRDEGMGVNVLRGLGYQGVCECDWKGKRWHQYSQARAEMIWHRRTVHEREQ
jgi:hypothetical protein